MSVRSLLSRLAGKTRRPDVWEEYGYPSTVSFQEYYRRYRREHIAKRIVSAPVAATWRHYPEVTDDDDPRSDTAFEAAWQELSDRLRAYHYFERVDRISGIGRYGVLLIGIEGQSDLGTEVDSRGLTADSISFFSAYHEGKVSVDEWETDPSSPRFNRPRIYELKMGGRDSAGQDVRVHWSRVIHVAEELECDEVYGEPRLEPVFNLFEDLSKVVGASAELFWQAAFLGLQLDLKGDSDLEEKEKKDLENQFEEFWFRIRRFIRTRNIDVKNLGGQVADPRGVFEVLMTLISGATGIPKRILTGSERGELASTQDETNWNARVEERRTKHAAPVILRPCIDRFLDWGVLPMPKGGKTAYDVIWPSLFELDEKEKAEVAWKKSQALKNVTPAPDVFVDVEHFIEEVLEWKMSDIRPEDDPDEEDFEREERSLRVFG